MLEINPGVFTLLTYTTVHGEEIRGVRVGYESYGKLNSSGDNAILIGHYLLGNCHAAGKYAPDDRAPGFWDSVIGPGKAFDTDRYFVLCVNSLANINTKDPRTVTTGPASIDPATGKPYGMRFPIVTMQDFVHVQKALVDSLGIRRIQAVSGPSVGAMIALAWATSYPEMVERVIPVVPPGTSAEGYLIGAVHLWMQAIQNDPRWNGGDYYGKEEPLAGLRLAIKNVVIGSHHYRWAKNNFDSRWAKEAGDPARSFAHSFKVEEFMDQLVDAFIGRYDANSLLYLLRAIQLFSIEKDLEKIQARVLLIPSESDLVHFPAYARSLHDRLQELGKQVEWFELEGDAGHFDGVGSIQKAEGAIRGFLSRPGFLA